MDAEVNAGTRLDAVVAFVDAKHMHARLADSPEIAAQIVAADLVLVNKSDLASAAELDGAESAVRALNPFADVRRTTRSALPLADVLDRHAFDLRRVVERLPGFAERPALHDAVTESVSFMVDRPIEIDRFLRWIDTVLALQSFEVLRVKGILNLEGHDRRFVLQAVNRVMDGDLLGDWPSRERRSKLVVIGRNLDRARLRRNFEGCQVPRSNAGSWDMVGTTETTERPIPGRMAA